MIRCPLCETGHPLKGDNHIPTQQKGMIPTMRCRNKIKRGDIAKFRMWLNINDTGRKFFNYRYRQSKRLYGDYLYFQDKDKFINEMCQWLVREEIVNE